jgi:predicted aspartyl protease
MRERVVSSRFPYLPLQVRVGGSGRSVETLLDTGFDGDLAVPPGFFGEDEIPRHSVPCTLADGTEVLAPAHRGEVRLGSTIISPAVILTLGVEVLVGRGISDRFTIILDHGRQVIVEP